MSTQSLLRSLVLCAVIAIPASMIFPHILIPGGSAFFDGQSAHLFSNSQFWLMWCPWYASFFITSFVSTWMVLRCKRTCGSHTQSNMDDDDEYDDDEAPHASGPREVGTVKWFNGKKGFGFITRADGEDIFVHHRSIRVSGRGRRFLNEGQQVEYTVTHKGKGPQAEDVVIL